MSLGGLILLSLSLGVGAWLFFLWSAKSGQYDDPEGPKYRMLDDDDEAGPPSPPAAGEPGRRDGAGGPPAQPDPPGARRG